MEVKFKRPSIGPRSEDERQARAQLEAALSGSKFSAALGWIISLEGRLDDGGIDEIHIMDMELQRMPAFQDATRQCLGWATLLYFTYQVHSCMSIILAVILC